MTAANRPAGMPDGVDLVLREFVNALSKAGMYPPGHRFISDSSAALVQRLTTVMAEREALTLGILPRGLLVDGNAVEPLSAVLRDFAARMHRRNIGTIQIRAGVAPDQVAALLAALASPHADEEVGRDGLRLEHVRVEPISYDALSFADDEADQPIDQRFWEALVESAFGRALAGDDALATGRQLAEAISERAASESDGATRVYDALTSFATALASRGERHGSDGTARFNDVLMALSRNTTARVLAAAPSAASRRRFLRESLELVPPALLLQLLEGVAEADGEPISAQLRMLLGKVAGDAASDDAVARDTFTAGVLGLIRQWDGGGDGLDEHRYPQLAVSAEDVLRVGMAVGSASPAVLAAARRLVDGGQLAAVLRLIDAPAADRAAANLVADAVLDVELMSALLREGEPDFGMIERIALRTGAGGVSLLLDALGAADDRTTRRRILDLLVRIGPAAEPVLLNRMTGAPWYLLRNILAVLAHFASISNIGPVLAELSNPEIRVRQEALKVLMRQPAARERASAVALESGDESLARIALTALGTECPPRVVPAVLVLLRASDDEVQLLALRTLSEVRQASIVEPLLGMVRARRGLFRRQRLLPRSPIMLGALEILARRWRSDRNVAHMLELARKSTDADIRTAAGAS
ncbi:MAG TPA: HEAT repeat domain-containing protein [Gemmatimonadales bacterium]|jgi:hypothetical protein